MKLHLSWRFGDPWGTDQNWRIPWGTAIGSGDDNKVARKETLGEMKHTEEISLRLTSRFFITDFKILS